MSQHGRFITIEGGEGSGKTTQIEKLANALRKAGKTVITTREPGGHPGAEQIRDLLLRGSEDRWDPVAETLLFQAARVQHFRSVIEPALRRGEWVVCDRYIDSTIVYQGMSKGLGKRFVEALHSLTLGNVAPHLTLLLDIDPVVGLGRAAGRGDSETRFEQMAIDFHRMVREGFLSLAKCEPGRMMVIDAGQSMDAVHVQVVGKLNAAFGLGLK